MAFSFDFASPNKTTDTFGNVFAGWRREHELRKQLWHKELLLEAKRILKHHQIPIVKDENVWETLKRIKQGHSLETQGLSGEYRDNVTELLRELLARKEQYREKLLLLSIPREENDSKNFYDQLDEYGKAFPYFFKDQNLPQYEIREIKSLNEFVEAILFFFDVTAIDPVQPLNEVRIIIHGHGGEMPSGKEAFVEFDSGDKEPLNQLFVWIYQKFYETTKKSPALNFCTALFSGCQGRFHEPVDTGTFRTKRFEGDANGFVWFIGDFHEDLLQEVEDTQAERKPGFELITIFANDIADIVDQTSKAIISTVPEDFLKSQPLPLNAVDLDASSVTAGVQ